MLKLEGITKAYGKDLILDKISLQVGPEIKALIGLNGCGKSTLLKIVAGTIQPDSGRIFLGDEEITHLPLERRHIGYVPQRPALFSNLTVEGNIRYGMRNGRGSEEWFRTLVELLDLEHVLNKKPRELSGGYQNRTSLARSLAPNPRTILLDEPLTGMDIALKEKMLPEFKRALQKAGVPVLFVTHDPHEAKLIADSFAVMSNHQIKSVDSAEEAFELMRQE